MPKMSTALLKKSLELVDTDFVCKTRVVKRKRKEKQVYTQLNLVNKRKKNKKDRGIVDVKQGNINSIDKIKKQLKKKDSQENINKKLKLLHKTPHHSVVKKVLEQLGYGDKAKKKSEEEQKTAFTEEDFLRFEREYIDTD